MRKSDIAAQVAGRASLTKAQAKSAVNAVFEVIRDTLGNGDTVSVTGFGRFSTKRRPARPARNAAQRHGPACHRHPTGVGHGEVVAEIWEVGATLSINASR